jgi:threonine/homoserine/homoserine lactone efflux protein
MDYSVLFKGIIIGFTVSAPMGPIGVLCVQRTLNKGRLSGFISGMGAAVADSLYAIIAGLGLSIIIDFISTRKLFFELIGISLLVIIGLKIISSNPIKQIRKARKRGNNLLSDFASIAILTISNPLSLFLFIAVFAGLGMMDDNINKLLTSYLVIGVFTGATLWWFILSSIVNLFRAKFRLRSLWWINKIAGAVLILFALISIIGMFIIH